MSEKVNPTQVDCKLVGEHCPSIQTVPYASNHWIGREIPIWYCALVTIKR